MMMFTHARIALVFAVCLAGGCRLFPGDTHRQGHSPLKPAQPSPDSVAMEIIWARFSANHAVLDDAAWREIDETQIEPSTRRALVSNGLRAGVISGTPPAAIQQVLHHDRAEPADTESAELAKNDELVNEPRIQGHIMRLRRHQRTEIQASDIYPSLPLLVSGGTELGGHTYYKAQAVYALRVDPQPDRSAQVELTPELHYGEPRLSFAGGENRFLQQASLRDRKVFDELRLSLRLAPGEMLVLVSLPDAGSRLGHYFHTVDTSNGPQQKLILIRLAEVPPSDTFD
jgi:hypothetical protein